MNGLRKRSVQAPPTHSVKRLHFRCAAPHIEAVAAKTDVFCSSCQQQFGTFLVHEWWMFLTATDPMSQCLACPTAVPVDHNLETCPDVHSFQTRVFFCVTSASKTFFLARAPQRPRRSLRDKAKTVKKTRTYLYLRPTSRSQAVCVRRLPIVGASGRTLWHPRATLIGPPAGAGLPVWPASFADREGPGSTLRGLPMQVAARPPALTLPLGYLRLRRPQPWRWCCWLPSDSPYRLLLWLPWLGFRPWMERLQWCP